MTTTPHDAKPHSSNSSTQVLYWAHVTTPLGELFASRSYVGLRRLTFEHTAHSFLMNAEHMEYEPAAFVDLFEHIEAYFAGERVQFDVPLDLRGRTDFQRDVLRYVYTIPYGETRTYGDVAKEVGRPRAARAVGSVMANSPIVLVVPCHRVIASGGKLGGYNNLGHKRYLLRLEEA